ncbi:kinase-like domain-containing protein [Gautieria morchelliformis]|nr:kinase-like domain-containing protein [Gautieria morchelliformis]
MPCHISSKAPSIYNPQLNNQTLGPLKSAVFRLLGREVLDCTRLGRGFFNVVYGLKMADGEQLVARITYNFKTDEKSYQWIQDRLTREILVLKLLKHLDHTLPVPQIYVWDFDPSNSVDAPFSVMERLYGEDQWSAWPKLTSEEKIKFVQSLADASARIFKVSMPSIGSLEKLTNENHPIVGPFIRMPSDPRTGGPYATIDEYLAAELQPWTASGQSEYEFSVPELFERLHVLAHRLVPRDAPPMLRPVLFHTDLDVRNVMVNDGIVSGIIDWEVCPNFTLLLITDPS